MEVREGYKQTDVGVIPEDWDVVAMGDIGQTIIGLTYTPSVVSEYGTLVLRSSNVQNNKLAFHDNVYVNMDVQERVITHKNDILICVRNGSKKLIGKVALIDEATAGSAFGAFMSVYRTEYAIFMFHQFQSSIIQKQINTILGATINQITNKDLNAFKVVLPPKPEQKAIAQALSDVDALTASLERLIAKKRHIKQGTMQELLTPKDDWIIKPLGSIANIKTGTRNNQDKIGNGKYPFFVRSNTIERINDYSYNCEAILVPGEGNIGKIFHYINGKFDVHQRVYAITEFDKNIFAKYIYLYMKKYFGVHALRNSVKATVDSLRLPTFVDFEISLPPLSKQKTIATILSDMDSEIEALEKKLEKSKEIKAGMMDELLTGKIRLVIGENNDNT